MMIFILCTFLLALPAQADATTSAEFPQKMQGFWTLPDCRNPKQFSVYSRFFKLAILEDAVFLERIQKVEETDRFTRVRTAERSFLAYNTNDGVMELIFPNTPADFIADVSWEEQRKRGFSKEYMHCYEVSAPGHEAGILAMEHLDSVASLCEDGLNGSCAPYLFSIMDIDKNEKLSEREIAEMLRKISYIATVSHAPVSNEEFALASTEANHHAPTLAKILVAGRDKNNSHDLDISELADLNRGLPAHESATYFKDKIRNLNLVFHTPSVLFKTVPARPYLTGGPLPLSLSDRLLQSQDRPAE